MTRAKKTLAWLLVPATLLVLWLLGPEPLATCPYVQKVTPTSAVIARIDGRERKLRLTVTPASPHSSARPVTVVEERPAREHAIAVTGLAPRTLYRYRLEELDAAGRATGADRGEFRTADEDDRILVRFAAVGDTGHLPWWICFQDLGWLRARPLFALAGGLGPQWDVAKWISRQELDFFVHLGDIVYPKGEEKGYREGFFLPFEPVLRRMPVYPAMGNHDATLDRGATLLRVFHLPEGAEGERYYSFTWGPVRIVVLDTSASDPGPQAPMGRWLAATLAENTEPWVIVAMHHPIFSVSREYTDPGIREHLWPVFTRYGVDLVLTGHAHNYQRYAAVEGVVQVTSGGGGKSIYELLREDPRLAASAEEYGFLLVEVVAGRLSGEQWGRRGQSLDEFTLDRADELARGEWGLRSGCPRCEALGRLLQREPAATAVCRHGRP